MEKSFCAIPTGKVQFLRKYLLIMKLSILLLFISMQVSAVNYAQQIINLKAENISIQEIFARIEKQTKYHFYYSSNDIPTTKKFSVTIVNAGINQTLSELLGGTYLRWKVVRDNKVIISLADEPLLNVKQYKQVLGTVKNEDGEAIIGASINVKGTARGVVTDASGNFAIEAVEGDVLEISAVGYVTSNVTVTNESNISITLKRADNQIEEVVVTAFGISRKTKELPYSVPTVSNKEITHAGTDNIATALAGKIAGVNFSSSASGPMGGNMINVRGINSLSSTNTRPLIILNGMPIADNDDNFPGRGFGNGQKGSLINDIDPNDIESISVLSGANAAALYGSQAFNGVIVINTKSGTVKRGLGVDYTFNYTKNKLLNLTDFQTDFGGGKTADRFDEYRKTGNGNDSVPFYRFSDRSFGPRFEGQEVLWWDGQTRPWMAQPDNLMGFFNDGSTLSHSLGLSGSTDKSSFRLSGTMYDYNGVLPNMKLERNSVLFSGSHKISDIITADVYINYIHNYRQNSPERIDRANYSLTTSDIPSLLKENTISQFGYFLSDSARANLSESNLANWILDPLVWSPNKNRLEDTRNNFLGNATITIQPIKQVTLRFRGGTQRLAQITEAKQPFKSFAAPNNVSQRVGGYSKFQQNDYKNHGDVLLTYNGNLSSNLNLNAFAGYSMDDYYFQSSTISDKNGLMVNNMFSTNNYKNDSKGQSSDARAGKGGDRLNAVFGSFTLGYKSWLFLNGTLRNDWSSYLPKETRSFSYPSFGASFVFSDALDLPQFINYGKLRAGYGITGNPGSRYFANNIYNIAQGLPTSFNGAPLISFSNDVPPVTLIAEKNKSTEVGLDLGMFKDRLKLNLTYYSNQTDNMITKVAIPPSTGAANLNINAGSMKNTGLDVKLTGDIIRSENVLWQMTLNGTSIKRKVLSLPGELKSVQLGNPFSTIITAEIDKSPYDIQMNKWKRDNSGNLVIGANGMPILEAAKSIVGNTLPKMYGGLVNSFAYKDFSLDILLEYRFGGQVVAYDNQFYTAVGLTKETLYGRDEATGGIAYYTENGVKKPVNGNTVPAGAAIRHDGMIINGVLENGQPNQTIVDAGSYYYGRYYNFGTEDAVYDNNYIRLRELSLTYNLPKSLASKIKAENLSISLIGRNLWFLYNTVPNESPDNTLGTDGVWGGLLYSAYPTTRDIGVALKVNF